MAAHSHSRQPAHRGRPSAPGHPARPGRIAAALVGLGPVVGAILGRALGSHDGTVFAVVCVASAVVATGLVTRAGMWWTVPIAPVVVWAVGVLTELSWHEPPYQNSKELAVGVVHGTVHAFPVMVADVLLTLLLAGVRTVGARRGRSAHV